MAGSNSASTVNLTIDPEFRGLIPPLAPEERAGLEKSILAEGVRDPIVVWGETVVDGHNRYEIANGANADGEALPFTTVERDFAGRNAAKIWIIENQLEQRRNLSNADRIELAETKRELIEAAQAKGGRPVAELQSETLLREEHETNAKVGKAAGEPRYNKQYNLFGGRG